MMIIFMLVSTSCSVGGRLNGSKATVNNYFNYIKELNSEEAIGLFTEELKLKHDDNYMLAINKSEVKKVNELYGKIKWKITSVEETDNSSTVTVSINSPDMDKYFTSMFANLFFDTFESGKEPTEKEIEKSIKENDDVEYKDSALTFNLVKDGDNWLIDNINGEIYGDEIIKEIIDETIPAEEFSKLRVTVYDKEVHEDDWLSSLNEVKLFVKATNKYDKDIKEIKGRLYVKDKEGEAIDDLRMNFERKISIGKTRKEEFFLNIYNYPLYDLLYDGDLNDFVFSYVPSEITFADKTKISK